MRELYVISRMDIGGAERIVVQLCDAARRRGDHAAVASSGGVWVPRLAEVGATHHDLPRMGRQPWKLALAVWRLRHIIRAEHPDVVHAVNVKATGVARAATVAMRRRPPIVTSVHGVPADEYPQAVKVLARASTRVIACAPAVADHLVHAGFPPERLVTVTNAVALEPADNDRIERMRGRLEVPAGMPLVVGVGRLVDQKDWPAWIEVARAVPDAWFALGGDGPLRAKLAEAATAAGNVAMLGRVDDVAALHGCADLFLSTSKWEGLPLSMLEAMSLGVPVVVTAVDGVTDAVSADAALLVEPGDSSAIARTVRELLADQSRRRSLADAGRRVTASPTAAEVNEGYERVHRACLPTGEAAG
jgi:glycosyltransferase involved in cell wall biosynthesis